MPTSVEVDLGSVVTSTPVPIQDGIALRTLDRIAETLVVVALLGELVMVLVPLGRRAGAIDALHAGLYRRRSRVSSPRSRLRPRRPQRLFETDPERLLRSGRRARPVRRRADRYRIDGVPRVELERAHAGPAAAGDDHRAATTRGHGAARNLRRLSSLARARQDRIEGCSGICARDGAGRGNARRVAAVVRRRQRHCGGPRVLSGHDPRRRTGRIRTIAVDGCLHVDHGHRLARRPAAKHGQRHRQFHSARGAVLHPGGIDHGARGHQRAAGPLHPYRRRSHARAPSPPTSPR